MPMITKTNYPPGVAVFEAEDYTPEQLARKTRSLLFDFNFSAVVILRENTTLEQTKSNLLERINKGKVTEYYKIAPNNGENSKTLKDTLTYLEEEYGSNFAFQATIAANLGASNFTLYTNGTQTNRIHLDRAENQNRFTRYYQGNLSQIATGITCTMSPQVGTDLIELSTNQFKKSKNNPLTWDLIDDIKGKKSLESQDQIWHTPKSSFVFMHSQAVKNTYPCAHRTPELDQNYHRTVGVAFICGMN